MIQATEADIGRWVVYDARPILPHLGRGKLVGLGERRVSVLFDGADGPINVISNLKWADENS